jgi:hypothetical protein
MTQPPAVSNEQEHAQILRGFVPGPIFYVLTVLVLVLLVIGSQPEVRDYPFAYLLPVGLLIGLAWGICFALEATDTRLRIPFRRWASWIGIPAIALVALALTWSNLPMTGRFEISRSSLEQAAAHAESGAEYRPGWIGLMHVQSVNVTGETTLFVLSGDETSGAGGCGLAYANGSAPDMDSWEVEPWLVVDYGHGWRYWCNDVPPMEYDPGPTSST